MKQQSSRPLRIQVDGRRRFISVPVSQARQLHEYLRSRSVQSSPPEPAFTGFDNIELAPDSDVPRLQAVLDDF